MKTAKFISIISACAVTSGIAASFPCGRISAAEQQFTESTAVFDQYDCGYSSGIWIYTKPEKKWAADITEFSLLLIDIGGYSSGINETKTDYELDNAFFESLELTLKNARKNGTTVGIRLRYDSNGTQNPEPEKFETVLRHIEQLGESELLSRYENEITFIETGMVGAYGEQWGGKYVSLEHKAQILDAFLNIAPKSIPVLVRTPNTVRQWLKDYCQTETTAADMSFKIDDTALAEKAARIGLYNDGYMGSDSDLGTFQNRKGETAWLSGTSQYGGEFSGDDGFRINYSTWLPENAIPEMYLTNLSRINGNILRTRHISKSFETAEKAQEHLDSIAASYKKGGLDGYDFGGKIEEKTENGTTSYEVQYDLAGYDAFVFDEETDKLLGVKCDNSAFYGLSTFDFIRAHLGYRYVLRSADITEKADPDNNFALKFSVENTGFADSAKEKELEVILTNDHLTYIFDTETNPKEWSSGTESREEINITLPKDIPGGKWKVGLRISGLNEDEKYDTYQCVRLANEGIEYDEELGANFIGNVEISGEPDEFAGKAENMRPAGYFPESREAMHINDDDVISLLDKKYTFKESDHYGFTFLYKIDGLKEPAQLGNWFLSFKNNNGGYSSAYTTYGLNTMNLKIEENGCYALSIPFYSAVFNHPEGSAAEKTILTSLNINDSRNYWSKDTFTKVNGNTELSITPIGFIEGAPEGCNVTFHLRDGDVKYSEKYGFSDIQSQNIINSKAVTALSMLDREYETQYTDDDGTLYAFKGFTTKRDDPKYIIDDDFIAIGDIELFPLYEEVNTTGDLNNDGCINSSDISLMIKWLLSENVTINKKSADINSDGTLNIIDLIFLKKLLIE